MDEKNMKDTMISIRCSKETAKKWSRMLLEARLLKGMDAEKFLLHLLDQYGRFEPRPRVF
jgi:hypothetical protein